MPKPMDRHEVPFDQAINCKPCHRSLCLSHLLEGERALHATELFLAYHQDSSGLMLHQAHLAAKENYLANRKHLVQATESGTLPPKSLQLVDLAKMYTTCQPVGPYAKMGWYDHSQQLITEPVNDNPLPSPSPSLSSLTSLSSSPSSSTSRRKIVSLMAYTSKTGVHDFPQVPTNPAGSPKLYIRIPARPSAVRTSC